MKKLIWLDDTRNPNTNNWLRYSPIGFDVEVHWLKSYNDFVDWIKKNGLPDGICFDHDLGYDIDPNDDYIKYINGEISSYSLLPYNDNEKTGYDCAKWLVEYCIKNGLKYPPYNIQSDNTVGAENIDTYIKNYKKHCE